MAHVFVQAKACSVVWAQKLKWAYFQNFDENGGFWVKMVKQFKKMHRSSTQDLVDVKSYQEVKHRSVLLEGDRERC
jgi:carbonic anhydrase